MERSVIFPLPAPKIKKEHLRVRSAEERSDERHGAERNIPVTRSKDVISQNAMKTYNKLVRDKIPQIIQADGKRCATRVLSDEEYLRALKAKLTEEVAEYLRSDDFEELADVAEVLRALSAAHGQNPETLESVRDAKYRERGGFDKKIFLETVSDGDK